jgi:outer membrane biosynthesis protein TonB
MKPLPVFPKALPRRVAARCCVLLTVMGGAALAQTTGTVNPNPAPAESAVQPDVPPGGCMPIGLTASGEIVFPIQCKEFIDRERGKAVEQTTPAAAGKPAAADEKPAAEPKPAVVQEKPAARESEAATPPQDPTAEINKPADKPAEAAALSKRAERELRRRASRSDGCPHYRSYDAASGTYRGYDGRRRSC